MKCMQLQRHQLYSGPSFVETCADTSARRLETCVPRPSPVTLVSRQRLVGRTNGSSAYLLDLAAAVRQAGLDCSLVQPSPSLFGRMPILRLRPEMDLFSTHKVRGSFRLGRYLIARDPGIWAAATRGVLAKFARRVGLRSHWFQDRKAPYSIAVPWSEADKAYVAAHVPDGAIVIADYIFQTAALEVLGPRVRASATIMHDLFHKRAELVEATGARDSVTTVSREDEIRMLGRADLVIAIQKEEADFVAETLPGQPVITVPISFPTVSAPQPGRGMDILFVGSNTEPNIAGLKWFCATCWPTILAAVPEAQLTVVGSVAMGLGDYPAPASVRYLGMVDDLQPLYRDAGVVISPLTFGSGLKIKLIEAMALGKAIVATSVTLQGVREIVADAVVMTDDSGEFAASVIALATDDALRLQKGQKALAKAEAHFTAAHAQSEFRSWLMAQAAAPGQPPAPAGCGQDAGLGV